MQVERIEEKENHGRIGYQEKGISYWSRWSNQPCIFPVIRGLNLPCSLGEHNFCFKEYQRHHQHWSFLAHRLQFHLSQSFQNTAFHQWGDEIMESHKSITTLAKKQHKCLSKWALGVLPYNGTHRKSSGLSSADTVEKLPGLPSSILPREPK